MKRLHEMKNDLEGVEFLRDAVEWLNRRDEDENVGKSPNQLLKEYLEELRP